MTDRINISITHPQTVKRMEALSEHIGVSFADVVAICSRQYIIYLKEHGETVKGLKE